MAGSVITGAGVGMTHLTYEDINILRNDTFNIENFVTVKRGMQGTSVVFEDILPAIVQHMDLADVTGCGLLPDPNCLTAYNFTAQIDKIRLINDLITACDWSHLGKLQGKYSMRTAQGWAKDEVKELFKWLIQTLPVSTLNAVTGERLLIEKLVTETETQLFADMGDLAPDRSEIIVVVGSAHASALREIGFNCCDVTKAKSDPQVNLWDVKGVYNAPLWAGVGANDILVYVPALKFEVTACEKAPVIEQLADSKYPSGMTRIYAQEMYGFQGLEFGKRTQPNDTLVVVKAGVKYQIQPVDPNEPEEPEEPEQAKKRK